jgi:hypothetical protein
MWWLGGVGYIGVGFWGWPPWVGPLECLWELTAGEGDPGRNV